MRSDSGSTATFGTVLQSASDIGVLADRRTHPRQSCGLCITVTATDESGRALGPLLIGHCIDVSNGGIKFTMSQPLTAQFVRVEPVISAPIFGFEKGIVELLRRSMEGRAYVYAGRFTVLSN